MEYPTEDTYPVEAAREETPAAGVSETEIAEAQAQLDALRDRCTQRIRETLNDQSSDYRSIPSLEELRSERERLTETVRHHKDEQDSLALDIEGQEGAAEVYQVASRVQRFEKFAQRSSGYVDTTLRSEIDQVVEEDKRQSEAEVAAFIDELQNKRANVTRKIEAAQARPRSAHAAADDAVEVDEEAQKSLEHAAENVRNAQTLSEKVKTFRALKTKLQETISTENRNEEKAAAARSARLKNAELANARDTRQVRELNSQNAALTTNAQMLLGQLNVLHYGFDKAPTAQQMIEERKRREATPEPTPANLARGESGTSIGSRQSQGSRPASLAKPPLVASKPTVSQRSRDNALRNEREEVSASRRRGSDAPSLQSQGSRAASLSKPPLVASKPTESQRNRDDALRNEREGFSGSQQRSRTMSVSSEARPPSVAAKSTESQRNRESAMA